MMNADLPPEIPGLASIAGRYGLAVCDVWGVVHNGKTPFPETIAALRAFRAAHGPVILLTNAPRPASDVKLQFDRIGVPHDCYDALVTSGEAARDELQRRAAIGAPLPVFILGPERDSAIHDGLNIVAAPSATAEVVLCTGLFDDETETPEDYRDMLAAFRARNLPFLCANPDLVVRRGDTIVYCAGALARLYEEMGGEVLYFGKPYPPVYDVALARGRALNASGAPLMIGDGLETDIRGAVGVGWDTLFILGGIHGVEIGSLPPHRAEARLQELFSEKGATPRWRMDALRW
jgi:HAD superfamily hydrolase (TIGR01459 family)